MSTQDSGDQWRLNFLASSTVVFFSNLPFVLFGSSHEQPWSPRFEYAYDDESDEEDDDHPHEIQTPGRHANIHDDKPQLSSKTKLSKKRMKMKKAKKVCRYSHRRTFFVDPLSIRSLILGDDGGDVF